MLGGQLLAADDEGPGPTGGLVRGELMAEELEVGRGDLDQAVVAPASQGVDERLDPLFLGEQVDASPA